MTVWTTSGSLSQPCAPLDQARPVPDSVRRRQPLVLTLSKGEEEELQNSCEHEIKDDCLTTVPHSHFDYLSFNGHQIWISDSSQFLFDPAFSSNFFMNPVRDTFETLTQNFVCLKSLQIRLSVAAPRALSL